MNSTIRNAVAAALALGATQAFALPATEISSSTPALYVSGATATDNALQNLAKLATGGFCVANTLDIYTFSNNVVLFCSASIASGRIAMLKESNGGSANGIRNVAHLSGSGASALDFLLFTSANLGTANCGAGTLVTAAGDFANFTTHACTATTTIVQVLPEAGISDIDPDTFVGSANVTQAEANALVKQPGLAVPFSPIVSLPLYLALQKAQGLVAPAATSVGDGSVAVVPTMSSAQLRGIFSGNIIQASQLWSTSLSAGVDQGQVQLTSLVAANSGLVHLCRRGNTSGTMASFKILFLGEGCSKNSGSIGAFAPPDNSPVDDGDVWGAGTAYGADLVYAGFSSGNVRSCVDYHSVQGDYAVGIASTDNRPSASSRYRYIRTDGQAPSLDNVIRGNYSYTTENSLNNLSTISGGDLTLWNFVKGNFGLPAVIKKINESFQNALSLAVGTVVNVSGDGSGDVGLVSIPGTTTALQPAFPISVGEGRASPIGSMSRTYTDPNNCNMSYEKFPPAVF